MKEFSCGDVVPGCTATFREPDESALFARIGEHAHRDHGIEQVTDDLVTRIRAHIRDVPAA